MRGWAPHGIVPLMKTLELDYDLPPDLIAQHPCEKRDASRLLVVDRASGAMQVDVFRHLADYLDAGDCLVLNDTKVIRARLKGEKDTGAKIEVFLLHEQEPGLWRALVKPSARVRPGARVRFAGGVEAFLGEILPDGQRLVRFDRTEVLETLQRIGEVPLPPYIKRSSPEDADLSRYQTLHARVPGAVAAPTAGLHYTEPTFAALDRAGVQRAYLTLHVGYGTFRPIVVEDLEAHTVDPEDFQLPEETATTLTSTRAAGHRIIAVGTTSARVLETQFQDGAYHAGTGSTSLYIYPPYSFNAIDGLQTNFHLPKSSLLALVCAFAGTELTQQAYRLAVQERFRFYSYGDTMLVL